MEDFEETLISILKGMRQLSKADQDIMGMIKTLSSTLSLAFERIEALEKRNGEA